MTDILPDTLRGTTLATSIEMGWRGKDDHSFWSAVTFDKEAAEFVGYTLWSIPGPNVGDARLLTIEEGYAGPDAQTCCEELYGQVEETIHSEGYDHNISHANAYISIDDINASVMKRFGCTPAELVERARRTPVLPELPYRPEGLISLALSQGTSPAALTLGDE